MCLPCYWPRVSAQSGTLARVSHPHKQSAKVWTRVGQWHNGWIYFSGWVTWPCGRRAPGQWKLLNVVDPHHLADAEATEVLQRLHVAEARHGIEQLHRGGRKPWNTHTHTLLHFLNTWERHIPVFPWRKRKVLLLPSFCFQVVEFCRAMPPVCSNTYKPASVYPVGGRPERHFFDKLSQAFSSPLKVVLLNICVTVHKPAGFMDSSRAN